MVIILDVICLRAKKYHYYYFIVITWNWCVYIKEMMCQQTKSSFTYTI